MKKGSKILILALCIALLLCGTVIAINAADGNVCKIGDVEYASISEAVEAAADGDTVKLTANAEIKESISITKNLTIDLNGKTLSNTVVAFTVDTDNINFTVTGNGYINASTMLLDVTKSANVAVTGTNQGIVVTQSGSTVLKATESAVVSYTNVFVFAKSTSKQYFVLSKNASFIGNKFNFELDSALIPEKNTNFGLATPFNLKDNIYIKLTDSSIRTAGGLITAEAKYTAYRLGQEGKSNYGDAVDFENVNVYANAIVFFGDNINNYYSYETDNSDDTTNSSYGDDFSIAGNININGGTLTSFYRTFVSNLSQDNVTTTDPTKSLKISLKNSTILSVRNDAYLFLRKNLAMSFDNCRILLGTTSLANAGGTPPKDSEGNDLTVLTQPHSGAVTLFPGTRFTQKPNAESFNYTYSDGSKGADSTTYEIAFDPAGDRQFPWVVVAKDTIPAAGKTYFHPVYNGSGNIWSEMPVHQAAKVPTVEKFSTVKDYNGNVYYKYYLSPEGYENGDVIRFKNFPGSNNNSEWNSFYTIGCAKSNEVSNSNALDLLNNKVIVYNINISSGSEWGFINADLNIQLRNATGGDGKANLKLENSTLYDSGKTKSIKLDPFKWYTVTLLLDVANNKAFSYLNGELMGSGTLYSGSLTENSYFQGLRFNPYNGADQVVGTSLLFDNLSGATYPDGIYTDSTNTTLDASKYVDLDNSGKMVSLTGEDGSVASFKANGIYYTEIDNALANGTVILAESNINETKLTVDGYIFANGHVLTVTSDSDAMLSSGSESDPLGILFKVDESLNDLTLDVYWYIGGSAGDKSDLNNQNGTNYVKTTVKPGQTPTFTGGEVAKVLDRKTSSVGNFSGGFALAFCAAEALEMKPISANEIMYYQASGEFLTYYAHYDFLPLDYEVTNSLDADFYDGGAGGDDLHASLKNLKNGDTVKLLNDVEIKNKDVITYNSSKTTPPTDIAIDDDYNEQELAALKDYADKIAIDLAGHKLTWTTSTNNSSIFFIHSNTVLSVYSSEAGGVIEKLGRNNNTAFNNVRAFGIVANSAGATNWGAYNAHLEIGEYNGQYTGNITTYTAILAEAMSGDSSCSMTISGGTFVRATSDSNALFMFRLYNGSMTLSNGIFILSHSNLFQARNAEGTSGTATKYTEADLPHGIKQRVLVENSYIIMNSNGANILDNPGMSMTVGGVDTYSEFTYKNVYTNARVNPGQAYNTTVSSNGKVFVEGSIYSPAVNSPVTTTKSGVDSLVVKANLPFSLPGGVDYITYPTQYLSGGTVKSGMGYIKLAGAEAPEGTYIRIATLPEFFEIAITSAENTVTATFNDNEGNELSSEAIVKGGNAIYSGTAIAEIPGTVYKQIHNGKWSASLTNLTEDTVFTPVMDKELSVQGFKLALSLYSEFSINLYIPASYVDDGYVVSTGDYTMLENKVSIGTDEYYVLTQWVKPYEATRDFTFTLGFKDGEFEGSCSFTYSILKYAKTILEDTSSSFTAEDQSLIWYILNYVHETYKYIAVPHTPYVDEIAAVSTVLNANESKKIAHSAYTFPSKLATVDLGDVFKGATVMLSSAPKFVFVLNDEFVGEITVSYVKKDTTTATLSFTEADAITVDGEKCIVIEGMKAYEFLGDLTVSADGVIDGEAATVTEAVYNLDTFASFHNENALDGESETKAESEKCLALVNAFYAFVTEAKAYAN